VRRAALAVAFVAACAARPPPPSRGVEEAKGEDPLAPFRLRADPVVERLDLDPEAAWRFLTSRVTAARAEAQALDEEILLTFERGALHRTRRSGRRTTWNLPPGIELEGVPCHLLLRPDLTARLLRESEAPPAEPGWTTVVAARVAGASGVVAEFRLEVKDGRTFRSIETAG
jgi:hypothetical protein